MRSWSGCNTALLVVVIVHNLAVADTVAPSVVAPQAEARTQFMSTVEWRVQEPNEELTQRSRKLVVEQFSNTFDTWPELQGKRYEVRTVGNEVTFYLVTNEDMRSPIQGAVATMISQLNGRVRARGRSMYYRTPISPPNGGYLEAVVDDTHSKIVSITAQSVPLRDLLKEIKSQLGSLSYLVPGECAERLVDWSFGGQHLAPKPVETVMGELATLFALKQEKKNGTYIFSGECESQMPRRPPTGEIRQAGFMAPGSPSARSLQVSFPLIPWGE